LLYYLAKSLMKVYLSIVFGFKITGKENVPEDGPVIVVANHASAFDPIALGCACPRQINFMAKAELFDNPISTSFLRRLHAFPVRRGRVDREAYRQSMDILKAGEVLGMFPEGTRSATGELQGAHPGAARFAIQTGTPVVPAAIVGTISKHRKGMRRFREPLVRVVFGEPIWPKAAGPGKVVREETEKLAEEIMQSISQLMITA
jgi:1-acyl-sn-glycerol-3-phosphate acyltransferase